MVTMFFVFLFLVLFIVLIIPLAKAAQGRLFQQTREVVDPEWELYQQRQGDFPRRKPPQARSRLARVRSRTAGARSPEQWMPGSRGAAPC